jgi:acyl dehydratase
VLDTPTLPQQALLYRMCGDRSPLHADPSFARAAGYPMPILQGLCAYGMVCKAVVDTLLDADPGRVLSYAVRFTGVVYPGETLRTRVWASGEELVLMTSVRERDDAPALAGTMTAASGKPHRGRCAPVISHAAK